MTTLQSKPQITLKNILFATDFNAPACRALPFAVALASRYGARLYAAHAIPREAYALASPDSFEQVLRQAEDLAGCALNQTIVPLRHQGLECDPLVGNGDVVEVINHFAQEYAADLLVVGTSSRAGFGKVLLGSVAEELIRQSPCPVLTAGPQVMTLASEGVHNILCATDFSPASARATEFALFMAAEYEARLTLVHVMEGLPRTSPHLAVQLIQKRMRETIPAEPELFHEPEIVVETGAVGEGILRLASDCSVDLIVMGVRGAGGFGQAASRFGSIAHKVVSQAPCPVLTVGEASRKDVVSKGRKSWTPQ